jgi:superfamily I DNA/RNA helicase
MINIEDIDISRIEDELNISFDSARKKILMAFDDVQACPGSGKTTMVAAKLLILAKKWENKHQGICVLTHTNVAKNEIIDRLSRIEDGNKLLSFPHFIGTIQEFVNKFLAIPFLRSKGFCIHHIDDEMCNAKALHLLSYGTKKYLEGKFVTSLQELQYKFIVDELKLTVPGFKIESSSKSYQELITAKNKLQSDGYFYFHEMYAFAENYIHVNHKIPDALRHRFPIVLIDEMQDTQRFQDELLNKIFLDENVKYQRFGDPDQAIYSGDGEGNQTYNKSNLVKIENSHRFGSSIAALAKNLSVNRINLNSNKNNHDFLSHTIFLVDDKSRCKVFNEFAKLCERSVPVDCIYPIKTVGAVGKSKDDGLTIRHYLNSFDKDSNGSKFKLEKLIHYFHEAKLNKQAHEAYKIVLNGLVKFGQMNNGELNYSDGTKSHYSITNIRKYLKDINNLIDFNILVKDLLVGHIDKAKWENEIGKLLNFVGLQLSLANKFFIEYEDSIRLNATENDIYLNRVSIEINGRDIENEVATIHAVKGETHAATLVLETKYHEFDIGTLIDYILGENTNNVKGVRKIKHMKQLYVAFTRPKYLLCISVDKSRFPSSHINKSNYAGWQICDLTDGD